MRRSKTDIIYSTLSAIAEEQYARPTHIMNNANLSWHVLKAVLNDLRLKGFIANKVHGQREFIFLTPIGLGFLQRMREVRSLLMSPVAQPLKFLQEECDNRIEGELIAQPAIARTGSEGKVTAVQ